MLTILCIEKTTKEKRYYRPFPDRSHGITRIPIMAHPFPVPPTKLLATLKADPAFKAYDISVDEFPFVE